jgi:predicted DsbA family dithiol-disulfide isomerase
MAVMQFFYDYECPYCKQGYEYLLEQIDKYPEVEVEYRPIEAHPLPEDHFPHTNLACQSYYAAKALEADMAAFHAAMFQAIAVQQRNAEDVEELCDVLKDIVNPARMRVFLENGVFAQQIDENNDLAYEKSDVWYVPAFRMNGKKLDAKGGIGIRPEELRSFLKN